MEGNVLMHSNTSSSVSIQVNSDNHRLAKTQSVEERWPWMKQILSDDVVVSPHLKCVRIMNKIFVYNYLLIFLLETYYLFMPYANHDHNCIDSEDPLEHVSEFVVFLTSVISLCYIHLKVRTAYVDPESRVLVDNPKTIALNYLKGCLFFDFFVGTPVLRILIESIIEQFHPSFSLLLHFLQCFAMFCRILSMLAEQSLRDYIFESLSSKFFFNLFGFFFFSHVVGSCWYYFASQRLEECLRNACAEFSCSKYIRCWERNSSDPTSWKKWKDNKNAAACFSSGGFDYGIFTEAVALMQNSNMLLSVYSLFWGLQQISTMAGNQTPAIYFEQVLFTMFVTVTGLLLFSLLIGSMQNFLEALARRSLEMTLRRSDVERLIKHWRLPPNLRREFRESERFNMLATRGVNELVLLENLPDDLQRNIRQHIFKFVKKYSIFATLDERILDAIMERLKEKTYIKGSRILVPGVIIDKMVFIVHGKIESIAEDKNVVRLSDGDVCGEELITLCLEHYVGNINGGTCRIPAQKMLSKRMVRCETNVEAFTLRAADLEEVTCLYSGLLISNPDVQGAVIKVSPFRQGFAVNRIKLAWRCRKDRTNN